MKIENNVFNDKITEDDFSTNKINKNNTHLLKSGTFSIIEIVKKIFSLFNIFSTIESKKQISDSNVKKWRNGIATNTEFLLNRNIKTLSQSKNEDKKKKIESIKKDFFHKNLDGTPIKEADLEGTTLLVSLHSTLADLNEFIADNPNEEIKPLEKLKKDLEKAYPLALEIDLIQTLNNNGLETQKLKDEFCKNLSLKLKNLKKEERLLIPGGISGHAMCYELECINDSQGKRKMNLKIINSGQGSENHLSKGWFSLFATHRQTYQVKNIDPEAVEDETFLSQVFNDLFESRNPSSFNPLAFFRELFSGDKIYKLVKTRILKTGKGEFVTSKIKKLTHKEQQQGTCAKKIFTYWLKENLSEKMRRKVKQHYTEKSIEKLKELAEFEKNELSKLKERCMPNQELKSDIDALKNDIALTNELLMAGKAVLEKRTKKALENNSYSG